MTELNVTQDMNTDHLSSKQKKLANVILAAAAGWSCEVGGRALTGGGCRAFYTPKEWENREELYGLTSELIVCHDGGDLSCYFNYDYSCYEHVDKMNAALERFGYYAEQCTSWYTAIYPL